MLHFVKQREAPVRCEEDISIPSGGLVLYSSEILDELPASLYRDFDVGSEIEDSAMLSSMYRLPSGDEGDGLLRLF